MYPAELIDTLIKLAGYAALVGIGYLFALWRTGRRGRADFRAGVRHADNLWIERIAQDRRDDAPLSQPIRR